jgi:hypothetical protein
MIPLIINFWPSPTGSGSIDCSVEYELLAEQMELTNVCISINLASFGSSMPKVDSVDGEFQVNTHTKTLDWRIPSIDKSSSSGTLEFSINGDDVNGLFPVQIHFSSAKPFSKVKVLLFFVI